MGLGKTKAFSIYAVCLAGFIILASVALVLLMQMGIGYNNEPGDLGEGIAVVLGVVFAIIMLIVLLVISVVTLLEGVLLLVAIKNKSNLRAFALIAAILKFIAAPAVVILGLLVFSLSIWWLGLAGILFALALIVSAIFDIITFSEMKKYFVWLKQSEANPVYYA